MFRIIGKTNIDFIGKRKISFAISGVLLVVGLVAFTMILLEKANFGLDFSGGTEIAGIFEQEMTTAELRSALSDGGISGARIQTIHVEDTLAFLIKVKSGAVPLDQLEDQTSDTSLVAGLTISEKIANKIISIIETQFPNNNFNKLYSNVTDPSIGRELKSAAAWMVVAAVIGILLYIWIRFDFRFGVAATFTTFHDVLLVLGIMLLLGREVSILMVTALLTLAGYSLTDTVVVFDRIRENLKTFRRKGDFVTTVNMSINEVLSRTLVTSITTLSVVVILFIFPVP